MRPITRPPIAYDVLDNLKQVNQGNQTRSFQYDLLSRLTQQTTPEAGTVRFTYTAFDTIATGSTVNGQARPESYSYDDLGRLASAAGYYAQRNYSYDRWGNRTAVSGGVSQTVTLQQSGGVPNNRIAAVNGVSYSYDAAGNLTSDGAHTYQYDAAGRIASVDNTAASYSYDAGNRRVKKVVGSITTYYIWEGGRVIAEYSNAQAGAGGVKYYLADRLSTRMVMDSSGAVIGTQDHVPYGEDAGTSTGQSEKHRFTNYERDSESGTDYAVNRQYAMGTGRFMRPDPVGGLFTAPQSFNRYAYALNDPINLTDPLGLYEPCVHQAMTEFLAKLSGNFSDRKAKKFGHYAGDGQGGADSSRYAVSLPRWLESADHWAIHFPTEEQLTKFKNTFWFDVASYSRAGMRSAGHTLHSIEDAHGAHKNYIGNSWGHASAGHTPDRIIGDETFINVSNEVLQFLKNDPNVKLTDRQLNDLIDAILKECGRERFDVKKLKITRPTLSISVPAEGDGAGYPTFNGNFEWYWAWLVVPGPAVTVKAGLPEICYDCEP